MNDTNNEATVAEPRQMTIYDAIAHASSEPVIEKLKRAQKRRSRTHYDTILEMLARGPVSNFDFLAIHLHTYSQRIGELKRRGFVIEIEHDDSDRRRWTYRWDGQYPEGWIMPDGSEVAA